MTIKTVVQTPCGPLILASELELLRVIGWPAQEQELGSILDSAAGVAAESDALFRETCRQLQGYFEGRLETFDLPVKPAGTAFQQQVWAALQTIPYGTTLTYQALADRLGLSGGARAVGAANGKNPISIVIPCHRVIGTSGKLTGYAGGMRTKQYLLELELGWHRPHRTDLADGQ